MIIITSRDFLPPKPEIIITNTITTNTTKTMTRTITTDSMREFIKSIEEYLRIQFKTSKETSSTLMKLILNTPENCVGQKNLHQDEKRENYRRKRISKMHLYTEITSKYT